MAPFRAASLSTSSGRFVHRHSTVRSIRHHYSNTDCPTPRSSLTTVVFPTTITTQDAVVPHHNHNARRRRSPPRSQRKTPSFPTTITTQDAVVPHHDHNARRRRSPPRSQRKTPSFPTTITTQDAVVPHHDHNARRRRPHVDITLSTTPPVATPVLARPKNRTHHTETPLVTTATHRDARLASSHRSLNGTTVHSPLGDGTPAIHDALAQHCVPVHHPISCRVDPCRRLEKSLQTPRVIRVTRS
ncbi:hypothetical protein SAMN06266787_1038 [Halorubrum ezzemoulense]|uniref:Uncharacterized protein n=1 Tax=Halorubrum ezzemoulense TaxID=337243 RepID=A0A238WYU2_HALEZ|nr:hypothetical protein SAMN06266787_1038 [Halorubrum ezzemoulense]